MSVVTLFSVTNTQIEPHENMDKICVNYEIKKWYLYETTYETCKERYLHNWSW